LVDSSRRGVIKRVDARLGELTSRYTRVRWRHIRT
jgi:hypothetical protein